jgi:REP element-mobilizing transposase RayT
MPSPPPLEYGCIYHIHNRGNNREAIFIEARNYRHFLHLYARYIEPVAYTYAYCLLRNHFHVLVKIKTEQEKEQTPQTSTPQVMFKPKHPSQQFGNLFNAYAKAINEAYQRTGSLFEHPYGRVPVTTDAHLVHLVTYIHQNPCKHGFVDSLADWPYSSYHAFLSDKPTRLHRDQVLAWFDGTAAFHASHSRTADETLIAPLVADDFD